MAFFNSVMAIAKDFYNLQTIAKACVSSVDFGVPRIAFARDARVKSPPEPVGALLGRAVREAVRHDPAAGLLLKTVVADRRGSIERFLQVARLDRKSVV